MTDRAQGISGTEVSALFGFNPYMTKFELYCRKKGLTPEPEVTDRMKMGKRLEPIVVDLFEEQTTLEVEWKDRLMEHPKEPLIIGTPDGVIHEHPAGFEAKTAGLDRAHDWGDPGTDFIPRNYLMQVQWYCVLMGRPEWYLAALIGGNDFRTFNIKADTELQALMVDEAQKFWHDHILRDVPPEIDYSDGATKYLLNKYPSPTDGMREATEDEGELILGILQTRKELKFLEQRKDTLQNQLKDKIGFAKGLTSSAGKVSWTSIPETVVASFTRQASRRLTVTGKKGESE